jgi:DNA-binding transcriptional MerR regulator
MNKLYSTVEVARMLDVGEHRLAYAFRTGKLDCPKLKIANKRVFTHADVRRVAEYFGVKVPTRKEASE